MQTSNDGSACRFTGGAYHAVMTQHGYVQICMAQATNFSNFAFQVNMTALTGAAQDGGGLVFRSTSNGSYRLRIGVDGSYDLVDQNPVTSGSSSAIKTGLNQTNVITVVAQGQHIYMYVNRQLIASVVDSVNTSGQIGVFAVSWTAATDVVYSNAQVWQL
jgi:hypothetical protein